MTRLALHSPAAACFDNLNGVPHKTRVVDNGLTGLGSQNALRQQADDVVALYESTIFVEEEAAIEIAVPGDTQIGA